MLRGTLSDKKPRRRIRLRRGQRDAFQDHQHREVIWNIEEMRHRAQLNLPIWACKDSKEEKRLIKMKLILKDVIDNLQRKEVQDKTVNLVEVFPDVYSDLRLLRFLRKDKIQDPIAAAKRFRHFVQDREANRHDELRLLVEKHPFQPPPDLAVVADFLPCDFRPVPASQDSNNMMVPVFLHVGVWNTAAITKSICVHNTKEEKRQLTLSKFLHYWVYMFDSLHLHLYNESLKNKQIICIDEICDLNKMSMGQFSPKFINSVLKPWIRLTQGNYPETAKRIVFRDPPKILSLVWRIVTPMISPGTIAKVSMQANHNHHSSKQNDMLEPEARCKEQD
jgi:hypothetical protein